MLGGFDVGIFVIDGLSFFFRNMKVVKLTPALRRKTSERGVVFTPPCHEHAPGRPSEGEFQPSPQRIGPTNEFPINIRNINVTIAKRNGMVFFHIKRFWNLFFIFLIIPHEKSLVFQCSHSPLRPYTRHVPESRRP